MDSGSYNLCNTPSPVVRLRREDVSRVVGVLCESFADYPVMRYIVGECGEDYPRRLRKVIHFFVMARALRDEPLLGISCGGDLCAVATVSFPGQDLIPPDLAPLRERVWKDLGPDAQARYGACTEAWRPLGVGVPHTHLNMIGVRPGFQRRGLARKLVDHVQQISMGTAESEGVTLTTEDPLNVPIYMKMGYVITGHARVSPGFETWGMFRKNPRP